MYWNTTEEKLDVIHILHSWEFLYTVVLLLYKLALDSSKRMCCVRCQIVLKNNRFFGEKVINTCFILKRSAAQIRLKMEKLYNFTP